MSTPLFLSAQPIDSLKALALSAKHDTTAVRLYDQIADKFFEQKQNDSALYYYNLALTKVKPQFENTFKPAIYYKLNRLFYDNGNYSTSLDYLFKIIVLYENIQTKPHDTLKVKCDLSQVLSDVGVTYFAIENFHKSLEYSKKAYKTIESLNPSLDDKQLISYLFIFTVNIGSSYVNLKEYSKAREMFEKALAYNERLGNISYNAVLYNSLGIIFKEENNFEQAHELYYKAVEIRTILKDTVGLAQVYNNLGILEYQREQFDKATSHFMLAYDYSKKSKSTKSQRLAADYLTKIYSALGIYDKAFEMQSIFNQINYSILNTEQVEQMARLELQYLHEREKKIIQLNQQIELAKKEKKSLIYLTIAVFFLFSLVILFLISRNHRNKIERENEKLALKQKNLNLENSNLKLTKERLKLELDHRNKELATHVMYLLQKNEYLTSVTEQLLSIKDDLLPKNQPQVQSIIQNLKLNIDNTAWEEFEIRFQNVQQDFYDKLHEKYPDLTPNEIKLCAFLRLNMTTKEISSITSQSPESIHMARSRLRKKLGISRDVNLISLLQGI